MFQRGKLYTHRNFIDVVLRVIGCESTPSGGYKLTVGWYTKKSRMLIAGDIVTVQAKDIKDYTEIE